MHSDRLFLSNWYYFIEIFLEVESRGIVANLMMILDRLMIVCLTLTYLYSRWEIHTLTRSGVCSLYRNLMLFAYSGYKRHVKWFDFYQQLNFDHEFYKRSALFSILSQNILLWWYFIASNNCTSNSSLQFALHLYSFIHISSSCSSNLRWSNLLATLFSSHLAVKKHIHASNVYMHF